VANSRNHLYFEYMKIFKHLRSDWFRYGFETLAVVVGILIAFALDNWNNERKQIQHELNTLVELKNALEADLKDIVFNTNSHTRTQNSCEVLIDHMDKNLPYHDSLAVHFGLMGGFTIFLAHTGPYETLKTKGLDLISNDSLRLLLSEYHEEDIKFAHAFEAMNLSVYPDTRQMYFQYFKEWEFFGPAVPYDYEELKNDREFLSYLTHIASLRRQESMVFSQRLDPKCRSLINDIEKEIALRQIQ
jgi:hypothetical protein